MNDDINKEAATYLKNMKKFGDMRFNVDTQPLLDAMTSLERSLKHLPAIAAITGGALVSVCYLVATKTKDKPTAIWSNRIKAEPVQSEAKSR